MILSKNDRHVSIRILPSFISQDILVIDQPALPWLGRNWYDGVRMMPDAGQVL
jgi:hypothetical protein